VRRKRVPPPVTDTLRARAVEDLRHWRVGAVVLPPHVSPGEANRLRAAMSDVLGSPPRVVGGVEVWDVRSLSG
jgi:hypothetical protein